MEKELKSWHTKFTPYSEQTKYYDLIANSSEKVVMLELPTGMGKTMPNIAATIDAAEGQIHYYSRTHEQIYQVMEEVRVLNELNDGKPRITAVHRAGRAFQCIHKDVLECKDETRRIALCKRHRKKKECMAYLDEDIKERLLERMETKGTVTTQDFIVLAKETRVCPRTLSKFLTLKAKMVVMPYNYAFLPQPMEDGVAVVSTHAIFDEAHALDENVLSSSVRKITTYDLANVKDLVVTGDVDTLRASGVEIKERASYDLREKVDQFISMIEEFKSDEQLERAFKTDDRLYYLKVLAQGISPILNQWMDKGFDSEDLAASVSLDKFAQFIEAFMFAENHIFRVEINKSSKGFDTGKTFLIRALDPAELFEPVIDAYNKIVICSGSLLPRIMLPLLGYDTKENDGNYKLHQFKSGHPNSLGLMVGSIGGYPLSTKFTDRSPAMYNLFAKSILNISQWSPAGTIVFCPSYAFAYKLYDRPGKSKGDPFNYRKPVFFATSDKNVNEYREMVHNGEKAILFSAYRGKGSEGANFPEVESRAVVLVGVPYLNPNEDIVKAQMNYYTDKYSKGTAWNWYNREAGVPIGQTFGRAYRSKADHGIVYLLGKRGKNVLPYLPYWVANSFNSQPIDLGMAKAYTRKYYKALEVKKNIKKETKETNQRLPKMETGVRNR